jgi:Asp-tRNA(Asn)/Glu-tRNA(Gln) amidotransferase A subunit family amidase
VQLIGRRGEERTLISLARQLEEAFGGWLDPDAK